MKSLKLNSENGKGKAESELLQERCGNVIKLSIRRSQVVLEKRKEQPPSEKRQRGFAGTCQVVQQGGLRQFHIE